MISVSELTKSYSGNLAVDHLSFEVDEGQVYGLLGPNGAGKSTTMNILTGYISATSGTVKIDGTDILEEPEKAKAKIGYLPEIPPVYTDMTVREYLKFVCGLKKVAKADIAKNIDYAIDAAAIRDVENRLIKNLSKGYRQRVGIAQALLGSPKVLIFDEPTVGLDPKQIIEIRQLIKSLGKKHTVILSSHILSEVSEICDSILIINKGKLVANGTPESLAKSVKEKTTLIVTVSADESTAKAALKDVAGISQIDSAAGDEAGTVKLTITTQGKDDLRGEISKALSAAGCIILGMSMSSMSLEDIFLELTGEDAKDGAADENKEEKEDTTDERDI